MVQRTRYRFVDFAARAQPGFRNHVVTVDEVAGLVTRYGSEECYVTIFRFADDVLLYLGEHHHDGRPSIAGYDGRVWAPFLPLDIDAHPPRNLDGALELARRTYRLLTELWEVDPRAVHSFFSGCKGFHLLVDVRAFGRVAPARDLHRLFSRLRLQILHRLPDWARPMFDLAIGDKVRLFRLPNTRHARSGLFKVILEPDELLRLTMREIYALARQPRPLVRLSEAGLMPTDAVAPATRTVDLFQHARRTLRRQRGWHAYRLGPPPDTPGDALCAARRTMWDVRTPPGNRNNTAIRLASAFRAAGYSHTRTHELLLVWNSRQHPPLPEPELQGVVHSAYVRPYPYAYGCHDEIVRSFCPFVGRWNDCTDYQEHHARSGRE